MATIGQLLVSVGVNASGVAGGLREAEKSIEAFGTRLFFLGSRITAGVTVPVAAAMGAVAKFGMEFDQAMTEATAIMPNMSASVRRAMEDVALAISQTTKFSAKEAAEAFYDLASAGLDAEDSMQALGVVATFAQAGVIDLGKAGEYLATATAAIGTEMLGVKTKAEGMQKVSDVLVKANNLAVGTTEDFVKALVNTKGALRTYQISLEQGMAGLMAFAQGGITGAKAGTQLLMVLRDMQTVSIRNAENWKRLGLAVYDTHGAMRPLGNIIKDLEVKMSSMSVQQRRILLSMLGFPDRSKQATMALLGFGDAIQGFTKQLEGAGGTAQDVANKQMLSMQNRLLQLRRQAEAIAIQIYRDLVPVIETYLIPALETGVKWLKAFSEWFGSLSTTSKAAIAGIVGFTAALGPMIALTGSWVLAASGVLRIFSGLTVATAGVSTAMGVMGGSMATATTSAMTLGRAVSFMLGPWGLAIAGAGLLAAAIYNVVTAESDMAEQMSSEGKKAFEDRTTQLSVALKMYDALSGQTKLTKGEQMALDAASRELAVASGLSAEAFEVEIGKSDALTESLKEQLGQRQALLAEMKKQKLAAVDEAEQALRALEQRRRLVETNQATKWISAGVGAAPVQMKLNMADRLAELKVLEKAIDDAQKKLNELLADPEISSPLRKKKIPEAPEPKGTGTGFVTPEKIELFDKFKKKLDQVTEALRINFEAGNTGGDRLMLMYKEYADEITELSRQSKIWEHATSDVFKAYELGFRVIKEGEDLDKLLKKIGEDTKQAFQEGIPQNLIDHFRAVEEERQKLSQKSADFQFRLNKQFMSDSEARIAQIEVERKKELDATESKFFETSALRDQARKDINAYYDFEAHKAEGTADTIVERMKDAGVKTSAAHKQTTANILRDFKQMQDSGKFTADAIFQVWKKWFDEMQKSNPFKQMGDQLGQLGSAFSDLANVAGEGFGGFAKAVGEIVTSMSVANKAADIMSENIGKLKIGFKSLGKEGSEAGSTIASGFLGLAAGIVSGISGLMSATSGGSLGKNIFGGAMSGAMLGGSVAFGSMMAAGMAKGAAVAGVWGAVAGAIVGIMVAVFRGRETRSIMKRVGHEWGVDISQGLADSIKKMMKDDELSRVAATAMNMDKIIEEAGGLNAVNFDKFIGKLRDVFSLLEEGELTATQATHILNTNFQDFANIVVESGKVASKEFLEIINLVRRTGLEVKAVTDFLAAQLERFGGAMSIVAQSAGEKFKGLAEEIKTSKDALAELNKQRLEAMGGKSEDELGVEDREKIAEIDKQRAEIEAKLLELQKKQTEGAAAMRGEMERIGMITLAGFNAAMAQGVGVIQAFTAVQPGIQALKQAYTDLGIEVDNAAVKQLFLIDQLMTEQPALVMGVGALGEAMLALSNLGGLNAETFALMQEQGMAMYGRLQEEAAKLGIDQSFAIQAMIPFLQAVLSANEEYGFTIDENTQKLIDQAREMGLLKEKELTTNDILLEGFSAIIDALGGEIPEAWKRMAKEAKDSLDDVRDHASDVYDDFPQPPVVAIPYEWDQRGRSPWDEDYDGPRGGGPPADPPEMAEGGVVRRRTHVIAGERGPEAIIPLSNLDMHRDREPIYVATYLDGRKVSKNVLRTNVDVLRSRGIVTR